MGPAATAAPGQCQHRLVCLPGTPKPTLMLMCPGKGGGLKDAKTTIAGDGTPDQPAGEAAASAAAVVADAPAVTPAATPEPVHASAPAAPERGVADWNWAYDPAKQL